MRRLCSPASLALCLMWLLMGNVQVFAFPLKIRRNLFSVKEVLLNMAVTSFDDQYKGCVELMEAEVAELNHTEFATNRVYADAWAEAASMWKERKASFSESSTLKPEHAIALMAYTVQGRFHKDFNAAVREAGRTRDDYLNHFHFKAFHFLLTRALHLLGITAEPRCHKVYRGVRNVRFASERAKLVRFGQFTSSSRSNESALRFGTDSFFTIETCYGVNIKNYSFFPGEEEVLIPPFEKFKVVNFTKGQETNFIHLLSLEDDSIYNCVFVKDLLLLLREASSAHSWRARVYGVAEWDTTLQLNNKEADCWTREEESQELVLNYGGCSTYFWPPQAAQTPGSPRKQRAPQPEKKCRTQKCLFQSGGGWSPFSAEDRAPFLLWGLLLAVGLLGPPGLL